MVSVPVFMYHHILPEEGYLAVSLEIFRKQMEFLAKKGYKTLTSEEFLAFKLGRLNVPKKSVFLTFDDGWKDIYFYAYPVLKEFRLKGTVFLVTSWVERASQKRIEFSPYCHKECKKFVKSKPEKVVLSWEEVEKSQDVFDFESHTHTHFEEGIPYEEEFCFSKELLERRLGKACLHLCWPKGLYTKRLLSLAKKAGYQIFYTTKRGVNLPDRTLDKVKRIAVKSSKWWFIKTLFLFSHKNLGSFYAKFKS